MKVFFVLIIVIAAALRLYSLGNIPDGLHFKESTVGWRAQNILHFGKDEFGRSWPLVFSNWQDLELPLPSYLVTPFVAISSKNPIFLRLPFALAGLLTVLGGVLLTQRLFPKRDKLALFVGLVLAVNPWTVWLSRIVSFEMLSLALIIWGVYFLLTNNRWFYLSSFLLVLAVFTSKMAIFFLLAFALYLLVKSTKKWSAIIILMGACISIIVLLSTSGGWQSFKDNDFSVFANTAYLDNINLLRGQASNSLERALASLFFNKTFYLLKVLENFISAFNPSFLFARGDGSSFHNPSNFGPFLLIFLPFLILGAVGMIKEKNQHLQLLVAWIVFSILPVLLMSSIQTDRLLLMIYPLSIFIAWGLEKVNLKLTPVVIVLITINLSVVVYDVIVKEPSKSEDIWHSSTLRLSQEIIGNEKIWLTDSIDPNPGPTLAYLLEYSYLQTNLKENKNIYKGWVSKLNNITIGDIKKAQASLGTLNKVISASEENNPLACREKNKEINTGKRIYEIYGGCNEAKH